MKKSMCLLLTLILVISGTITIQAANQRALPSTVSHRDEFIELPTEFTECGELITIIGEFTNEIRDSTGRTAPAAVAGEIGFSRNSNGMFEFRLRLHQLSGPPIIITNVEFIVQTGTQQHGSFTTHQGASNNVTNPHFGNWRLVSIMSPSTTHIRIIKTLTSLTHFETQPNIVNFLTNRTGNVWNYNHTCHLSGRQITPPPSNWARVPYTRVPNYRTTYINWMRTRYDPHFNLTPQQHVHHIRPLNLGGNNNLANLIHLPQSQHTRISGWFAGY